MKARLELRCRRDLEVSSEIRFQAVLIVPEEAAQIIGEHTVPDDDGLFRVMAELEGRLAQIPDVHVTEVVISGLNDRMMMREAFAFLRRSRNPFDAPG